MDFILMVSTLLLVLGFACVFVSETPLVLHAVLFSTSLAIVLWKRMWGGARDSDILFFFDVFFMDFILLI